MKVTDILRNKIVDNLSPQKFDIIDESAKHKGHAGARPGGESHFAVLIVSDKFAGKSRVERQKMVYSIFKYEMKKQIHALRFIGLFTPDEYRDSV